MFYKSIFTTEEQNLFLQLMQWRLIPNEVPKFMESSQCVMKVRHSIIRYNQASQVVANILPRIAPRTVLRIVSEVRAGNLGMPRTQLAVLFELGMGVPKQRDIARYIREYDPQEDHEGRTLKHIRKMIVQYQRNLKRSLYNIQYLPPAPYVAQMLKLQQFVHLREGGYKHKVKVPDGLPVVLIYANDKVAEAQFTLTDAFMISPLGYPVPFANIAMRKEFGAVKTFQSRALQGKGMYSMVFGVVYWSDQKTTAMMRQLRCLDTEESYAVLFDNYPELCSEELLESYQYKRTDTEQHIAALETVKEFRDQRSLTPKQQRRLDRANEYFAVRSEALGDLEKLEKREARNLEKTGPVATARFCAIDAGTIEDRDTFTSVKNPIEKVETVLARWGFETLGKAADRSSVLTYTSAPKGRCWSL